MMMSPGQRRSTLREAQAELTRERIVHAVADLLRTTPVDEMTMRDVAQAAGIGERTLYRYYADREALRGGVVAWLDDHLEPAVLEGAVEQAPQLPDLVRSMFARFDEVADVARASVLLSPAPGADTADHLARTERIRTILADAYADLPEQELHALVAVVRTLMSAHTWLRMHDEFGLEGQAAGEATATAVEAVLDAADRRTHG